MKDLQKPIIHLNGDSARDLVEQYSDAAMAIEDAIKEVAQTYPHMRNYYVDPDPEAGQRAQEQHESRLTRLLEVKEELKQLAMHCADFLK